MTPRTSIRLAAMSARTRAFLVTVVGAPLLLCCAATATAKRSKQPPAPSEVIELELREIGGSEQARLFVVPIDGKISGSIALFDEAGRCEARSRPNSDEQLSLELRCTNPQFELDSTRALKVDAPTILGEIEVSENRRLQVVATRR